MIYGTWCKTMGRGGEELFLKVFSILFQSESATSGHAAIRIHGRDSSS